MSEAQNKKKTQTRQARLPIVAALYKKGYSIRKICQEVKREFDTKTCSPATIQSDIKILLKEWRESRLSDIEDLKQLELERIDDAVLELWGAWERSKTDAVSSSSKVKGTGALKIEAIEAEVEKLGAVEKSEKREAQSGDPRYIAEIRQQLAERRKILGLYSPDKLEHSGKLDFGSFLIQASTINDGGQQSGTEGH